MLSVAGGGETAIADDSSVWRGTGAWMGAGVSPSAWGGILTTTDLHYGPRRLRCGTGTGERSGDPMGTRIILESRDGQP